MTRINARWARRRPIFLASAVCLLSICPVAVSSYAAPALTPPGSPGPSTAQDGRIYFIDGSTGQIVSTTASGSGRKVLKGAANSPAVSPDGTRIAYEVPTGRGIAIENADGTGRQTLVPASGAMPAWSPDGTKIAFSIDSDIAVVTVATRSVSYLSHDGDATEEVAPAWSPNGQWIAFTVRGCDPDGGGRCVYRMDAATGGSRVNLTPFTGEDSTSDEADWSPTNTLAYSSGGCAGGGINIWTMTAAGKSKRDLSCAPSTYNSDTSPSYAPSGTQIAFDSDERVDPNYDQLYLIRPDGSGIAFVDTGSRFGISDPEWAVLPTSQTTSLSLSAQPTTVAAGHVVKLSGRLSPASGQPYAGQSVVVNAKPEGSTSYTKLKIVKTAADGTWTTTIKPTETTSYQAAYSANPTLGLGSASSPAQIVTVD